MPIEQQPPRVPADDSVVVFRTRRSNVRGRLVRLGKTLDDIVTPHAMPDAPSRFLSEAIAVAALCGSALPDGGNLNLQVRASDPVSILVADYAAPGTEVFAMVRGKPVPMVVAPTPFVPTRYYRG